MKTIRLKSFYTNLHDLLFMWYATVLLWLSKWAAINDHSIMAVVLFFGISLNYKNSDGDQCWQMLSFYVYLWRNSCMLVIHERCPLFSIQNTQRTRTKCDCASWLLMANRRSATTSPFYIHNPLQSRHDPCLKIACAWALI